MRKNNCLIFFICLFLISACKKKDKGPPEAEESPAVVLPDTGIRCQDLPTPPSPFVWQDSITDPNKSINAFLFDPVDPDKIIYVVNGDAFGYNKLFFYHVPTRQARYICSLGEYLPQVNHKGWITYSDAENNIFLIKKDIPIQLTTSKRSHDPKWDHSGNYILYFNEAFDNIQSQLVKADTAGVMKNIYEAEMPYSASFRKSNRIIVFDTRNSRCTLVLKDLDTPGNDRELISGPVYSKPGQVNFDNLTLDLNDENFYWSNSNGIYKCNLASLRIDTLLKNCPNFIFNNPMVSFKGNELTYSQQVLIPLSSVRLLRQFRAMEMNLATRESAEIRIFP